MTTSIYAGLVDATLDPAHETVHIHSVAPLRDVDPAAVPALLSSLRAWAGRCEAALGDLDAKVKTIRAAADARAQARTEWEGRVGKLVEEEGRAGTGNNGQQGQFAGGEWGPGQGHGGQQQQHGGFGGGGSGLPARGSQAGRGGRGLRSYMKRGSGHMDGARDEVDDEAMDLDEEEDAGEKKRSSRRKLLG